MHKSQHFCKNT